MEKTNYTFDLLNELMERDGATLIKTINVSKNDLLNSTSRIYYKCYCGEEHNKLFSGIYKTRGAFCRKHVNNEEQYHKASLNHNKRYTEYYINEIAIRDCATVTHINHTNRLNTLTGESIITFNCHCGKEYNKKAKIIADKSGMFCKLHTNINKQNKINEKVGKKYTFDYLYKLMKRDNATLISIKNISNMDDPNCNSLITFVCHCGKEHNKKFKDMDDYGGAFCKYHTQQNAKQKGIEYCNIEYGYNWAIQSPGVRDKIDFKRFDFKEYTFPSGKIELIQGFENIALDFLLNMGYDEEDLVVNRRENRQREIPYYYKKEFRNHEIDIYIKSTNTIIEVKSDFTFDMGKQKVLAKQIGAKYLGYNYEIWVYNVKGEILYKFV